MSDKNIRRAGFVIFVIAILMTVPAVSATSVYFSQEKSVTSPEGLKISSYRITGANPELFTGDEITAIYMLQYESAGYNQLVIDQPGGLYFDLTDPQGYSIKLGQNYIGKTIYPGDYVSVKETFSLDKPGVWKISPAYTIIAGTGMKKISNPKDWQVAEISVLGKDEPLADLVIEDIKAEFDPFKSVIARISYTIKNAGDADSNPSITAIYVDGNKIDLESNVGYLPSKESITIFEPVSIHYSGSTSFIEAHADYDGRINESDYENNFFNVIIENPGFEQSSSDSEGSVLPVTAVSSDSKTIKTPGADYAACPVQVQGCPNTCFICGVIGLLSILLCLVSFALGYFYGLNKNCEREVRWMRSKIDFLRSDRDDPITKEKSKDDDISEGMEEKLERAIEDLKNRKNEKN